jgi:hypothetical protein
VAVDAAGNVFVADSNNDVLKEIPHDNGSYGPPVSIGSNVRRPLGVAVDRLGRVYVADAVALSVLYP